MANWLTKTVENGVRFQGLILKLKKQASDFAVPTIRLGVTGLSRSGKTVFITAMINNLLGQKNLPFFTPLRQGRIIRVYLEPQPNDILPRFDYEQHLATLTGIPPKWPEGTKWISQLRLTVEYEPASLIAKTFNLRKYHIDIVDYPGEWLLDLPLLEKSYQQWSKEALSLARQSERYPLAKDWLNAIGQLDDYADRDENLAKQLSTLFAKYLSACRAEHLNLSTIPPGRFLMPGDLKGAPALTFAPLDLREDIREGSLAHLMQQRYDAYLSQIVRPFYRNHFTRLDRQIVLVDLLSAMTAGREALKDLEHALEDILACFHPGANHWLTSLWSKKIDKLVFAATKADLLHHQDHDRLQNILGHILHGAIKRAKFEGAEVKVMAMAAIRATKEAEKVEGDKTYPLIVGTPLAGQKFEGQELDGQKQIAFFPGHLPQEASDIWKEQHTIGENLKNFQFLRFCPPMDDEKNKELAGSQRSPTPQSFPHIRLDRALDMLLGDKLS